MAILDSSRILVYCGYRFRGHCLWRRDWRIAGGHVLLCECIRRCCGELGGVATCPSSECGGTSVVAAPRRKQPGNWNLVVCRCCLRATRYKERALHSLIHPCRLRTTGAGGVRHHGGDARQDWHVPHVLPVPRSFPFPALTSRFLVQPVNRRLPIVQLPPCALA